MGRALATTIGGILARDLRALRREIAAYPDEPSLWQPAPGISNSGGTLALHLAGNLQQFVGAVFGKTGYVRDRDAEFTRRNVPREELLRGIDATLLAVERGMGNIDDASWDKPYPLPVGGYSVAIGDALTHLVSHLGYHLGQVDYHRRMVTGEAGKIGAVAVPELLSARPIPPSKP